MNNSVEKIERNRQKAKQDVKNSVFVDLFNIPEYQLQLFKTFHPEADDVTVEDIKTVTFNPVLVNKMYNDLCLLVKDRLLIFVEVQGTWSINILIRILMYLAMTYQDYISEYEMNVYGTKKVEVPKPEFYVVYTGDRQIVKDSVSLREDFFCDPGTNIDLTAKVLHAENKSDIIGQYIIFSHIFDSQVRDYGRTMRAIENTIRLCSNEGVLKEYLNGRREEVIEVLITLFDQGYAIDAYAREVAKEAKEEGREEGRVEGKIQATIELYQEYGKSVTETIRKVSEKFVIPLKKAAEYLELYWID